MPTCGICTSDERLSIVLESWEYWRRVDKIHREVVVFVATPEQATGPLLAAIEQDRTGSSNLATMHRKNER